MNIQPVGNSSRHSFTARFRDSEDLRRLTKAEVTRGGMNSLKEALQRLDNVHKNDILDIRAKDNDWTLIISNMKTGASYKFDAKLTLSSIVDLFADPSSRQHKLIFDCDSSDEVNQISKEFYV